jgi:DNA polymerase I-like protein with 3'-5' exonuclease and polymerase domains
LDETLAEGHKAVVAVGATATRRLLGIDKKSFKKLDNWHGCPTWTPDGKNLVVPTYHPAYLLRGNFNLKGTMAWDIKRAVSIANGQWKPQPAELVIDPPIEWFKEWCEDYIEAVKKDPRVWLAVDIETPDKIGKDEDDVEDASYQILRINLSCHPDEGVTVPWSEPYLAYIRMVLQAGGTQCYWNARYDRPRLEAAEFAPRGRVLDFMWGWHLLQSDLPNGLGFVAPFYSNYGAWKHLSATEAEKYAAVDSVQTLRVAFGIARDLEGAGLWDNYLRHIYSMDEYVLRPAEKIGLKVDKELLDKFQEELSARQQGLIGDIQQLVPEEFKPLHPAKGWKKKPAETKVKHLVTLYQTETIRKCFDCGALEVISRHRCPQALKEKRNADVRWIDLEVSRYYGREPFNPDSPLQVADYIKGKGYVFSGSTDEQALEALLKRTKDPFFEKLLEFREVDKVLGTYVQGASKRLAQDGRLHAQFTHITTTQRLSCRNPNLQNVVRPDPDDPETLASRFRACLVAEKDCSLVELDFAGIEAVETGWFIRDPDYIRLATLGIHDYVNTHLVKEPADLKWSDDDLRRYFKEIKKRFPQERESSKRCVHGTNYGLTPYGMAKKMPELFTTKSAEALQKLYFEVCPKLPAWHDSLRTRASKQGYLGGADHPFHYKHWFWNVYTWSPKYEKWILGSDANRVISFYPQSTSAGVLYEACLRCTDRGSDFYIGDLYFGDTPIRALVHDSILLELPDEILEKTIPKIKEAMCLPIKQQPCPPEWGLGEFLKIGVAVKVGKNWMNMREVK